MKQPKRLGVFRNVQNKIYKKKGVDRMVNFTYCTPTKLIFGKEAIKNLPEALAPFGKKVMCAFPAFFVWSARPLQKNRFPSPGTWCGKSRKRTKPVIRCTVRKGSKPKTGRKGKTDGKDVSQ